MLVYQHGLRDWLVAVGVLYVGQVVVFAKDGVRLALNSNEVRICQHALRAVQPQGFSLATSCDGMVLLCCEIRVTSQSLRLHIPPLIVEL